MTRTSPPGSKQRVCLLPGFFIFLVDTKRPPVRAAQMADVSGGCFRRFGQVYAFGFLVDKYYEGRAAAA